jgi:NAD-dependent deacetylase
MQVAGSKVRRNNYFMTVLFGEQLPPGALERAYHEASTCQTMLVIGTSAVVQPAASLPYLAKQNGAAVIEINLENAFPRADFYVGEKAGTALPKIVAELKNNASLPPYAK